MLKLQELLDVVIAKNILLDKEKSNLQLDAIRQAKQDEFLSAKENDLINREGEVVKVESVIALKKEAAVMTKQLNQDKEKFAEEVRAANILRTEENAKLDTKIRNLADLKNREKKLEEGIKRLEAEKLVYKDKITAEIKSRL